MIWHIVRFDFSGVPDAARQDIEEQLRALSGIETDDPDAWA